MHAELTIGNSMIFLSDEMPDMGCPSPESLGSTAAMLHLKVDDVDAAFQREIAAGANVRMPVADMFWGDRYGKVVDSFGHEWGLATRKEDLTQDQIRQRAAIFLAAWRNSEPSPLPNGERRRRGQEKANSLLPLTSRSEPRIPMCHENRSRLLSLAHASAVLHRSGHTNRRDAMGPSPRQ